MAEDTPTTPPSGPMRVNRIETTHLGAKNTKMDNVEVQRMTVRTDETKTAESDLLLELKEITEEHKDTITEYMKVANSLSSKIEKHMNAGRKDAKDLIKEMQNMVDCCEKLHTSMSTGTASVGTPGGIEAALDRVIDKHTENLNAKFQQLIEVIRVIALRPAGGGGAPAGGEAADAGAGGAGGGATFGEVRRLGKIHEMIERSVSEQENLIIGWDNVRELLEENLGEVIRDLNVAITNTISRFTRLDTALDFFSNRFGIYMNAASSGVADFWDVMTDDMLFGGLRRGGDSLVSTFELIQKSAQENLISPLSFFGKDIEEVSVTLRQTRAQIEQGGFDFFGRMGFQEMNETMLNLFDIQRRASYLTDIRDSRFQMQMRTQLEFLDLISQNTGKTVEELVKASQEDMRQISQLQASGILQPREAQGFNSMIQYFRNTSRGAIADMILEVARQGGSIEAYLGTQSESATGLAATGNIGQLRALADLARRGGSMCPMAFQESINEITKGFQANVGFLGVAGARVVTGSIQQILAEAGLSPDDINRTRQASESGLIGFVNRIKDWLTNTFPIASMAMTTALITNTIQLIRLNRALGVGGLFGGMFGRRGAAAAGGVARSAGAMATPAALLAGGGAAAASGGMRGMLGALAGGGLLKGAMRLGLRAVPILGWGLLANDIISMLTGFNPMGALFSGIGSLFGIGSANASEAPSTSSFGSMSGIGQDTSYAAIAPSIAGSSIQTARPRSAAQAADSTRADMIATHMRRQSASLSNISHILEEANSIGSDIRRNTRRIGIESPGFIDRITGADEPSSWS